MKKHFVAVIERLDGTTYEQPFYDFEDLLFLRDVLGPDYLIVDYFDSY